MKPTNKNCKQRLTPRGSETKDEDAGEGDEDLSSNFAIGVGGSEGSSNDLASEHDERSNEQSLAATKLLNREESGEGRDNVDGTEDDLNEERVRDSGGGEELDSVREEEVDSRPLLTSLDGNLRKREAPKSASAVRFERKCQTYTNEGTKPHAALTSEAVDVAGVSGSLLLPLTGEVLLELGLELFVSRRKGTELAKVDAGLVDVAAHHIEAWRLGAEDGTDKDEGSPDELEGDGEAPREGALDVVHLVVYHVGEEDSEGGAELVSRGDHSTEVLGRALERRGTS